MQYIARALSVVYKNGTLDIQGPEGYGSLLKFYKSSIVPTNEDKRSKERPTKKSVAPIERKQKSRLIRQGYKNHQMFL